jgi:peptidoglycan hydrolase-like protein with peptidoglycan-binding domain
VRVGLGWTQLNIDGIPGTSDMDENRFDGSLEQLRSYSAAFVAARRSPGSSAFNLQSTRGVQQALNRLQIATPCLEEDGVPGPRTKAAIEAFQKRAGIAADGIIGPNTLAALRTALGAVP